LHGFERRRSSSWQSPLVVPGPWREGRVASSTSWRASRPIARSSARPRNRRLRSRRTSRRAAHPAERRERRGSKWPVTGRAGARPPAPMGASTATTRSPRRATHVRGVHRSTTRAPPTGAMHSCARTAATSFGARAAARKAARSKGDATCAATRRSVCRAIPARNRGHTPARSIMPRCSYATARASARRRRAAGRTDAGPTAIRAESTATIRSPPRATRATARTASRARSTASRSFRAPMAISHANESAGGATAAWTVQNSFVTSRRRVRRPAAKRWPLLPT
jgi:hypothetical protein